MKVRLSQAQKVKIANSLDIYKIMKQILLRENKLSRAQERLWVVGLDTKNAIQYIELAALGSGNSTRVQTKDLLRVAILKLASKVILVHNHPSGDLNPSDSDIHFTETVKHGGNFTGIELLDHLIISERDYFSFADHDMIATIIKKGEKKKKNYDSN